MRYVLLKRPSRKRWNKKQILSGRRPIRRGIVSRARDDVTTKKPHSAKRKVAAFYIQNKKYLKNRAYMPGEEVKGQLKKYDTIFFNGNRRRDVPALKYTIVYGVHTKRGQMSTRVTGINYRRKARSKYGVKRFALEPEKAAAAAGIVAGDVPAKEEVSGNYKREDAERGGADKEDSDAESDLEVFVRGHWATNGASPRGLLGRDVMGGGARKGASGVNDATTKWERWDSTERRWSSRRASKRGEKTFFRRGAGKARRRR